MILKKRINALKDRLIYNIKRPEMRILPGQIAFFLFLTLIPIVALIGSFISLFDLPYGSISDLLNSYFPAGTIGLLEAISVKVNFNFDLLVFFCSSLLLASNGTHSMILASNQIYKIKDTSYIRRRIKALVMMFLVIALLLFVLFIPVFGDLIFKIIGSIDSTSLVKRSVLSIYRIFKYPLSFVFMYFLIKFLYIMAPDKRIKKAHVVYGSLFTSVTWMILNQIYSWYIVNFTNYTTFYGSVSAIVILMLWLYLLSYIFVLGMALNVTKYELDIEKNDKI